jgi:hypothetical protein
VRAIDQDLRPGKHRRYWIVLLFKHTMFSRRWKQIPEFV